MIETSISKAESLKQHNHSVNKVKVKLKHLILNAQSTTEVIGGQDDHKNKGAS